MNCSKYKNWTSSYNQTIFTNKSSHVDGPVINTFTRSIDGNLIYGRIVSIPNSYNSLKVLQANNNENGCSKHLFSLPSQTGAMAGDCEIVINAGLFNTASGECYGNVINNGKLFVNFGGIRTAHFGVKKDGKLFFGYLSEEEVLGNEFQILVGGAIWLLRNGKSVVNASVHTECADIQETGSLSQFAKVRSARSAVGAYANGTVVMVQITGKTWKGGVNLYELADMLASMGVVAAINLDGGGSSTLVINGTLVSQPSDECRGLRGFTCERPVTTVVCVRDRSADDPGISESIILWRTLGVFFASFFGLIALIAFLCGTLCLCQCIRQRIKVCQPKLPGPRVTMIECQGDQGIRVPLMMSEEDEEERM